MADDIVFGIRLKADGSGFVGQVRASKSELDKLSDSGGRLADQSRRNTRETERLGRAMAGTTRFAGGLLRRVVGLATAFAGGFGIVSFVRGLVSTNREFQSLEATLETFTGSLTKAKGVFAILQDFAASTPFSLQELVAAFNRMLSVGISPTIRALEAFGNVAAGSSKSVMQFVEAVADAAVGEFERLKEFGIKAASEGDKVTFTFKGIETTVAKTAGAISEYLTNLGRTEFAGAMTRQTEKLGGAFSNLGDGIDAFFKKVGDAGFNDALIGFTRQLTGAVGSIDGLAESLGRVLASGLERLPGLLEGVARAFRLVEDNAGFLANALIGIGIAQFVIPSVISLGRAMVAMAAAVRAAGLIQTGFNLVQSLTRRSLLFVAIAASIAVGAFDQLKAAMASIWETVEKLGEPALEKMGAALQYLGIDLSALSADLNLFTAEAGVAELSVEALDERLGKLIGTATGTGKAVAAAGKELTEAMAVKLRESVRPLEELQRRLGELAQLQVKFPKILTPDVVAEIAAKWKDELNPAIQRGKELADGLGLSFSSAFEDALAGGKGLMDILRGLEQDVLRLLTRLLVTKPLTESLATAIGSIGAGGNAGAGGGFLGGIFNSIGSVFAGLFHSGGIVGASPVPHRLVPAAAFANAPRMHTGGIVGGPPRPLFAPDERPIVAKLGERVGWPGRDGGERRVVLENRIYIHPAMGDGFRASARQIAKDMGRQVLPALRGA